MERAFPVLMSPGVDAVRSQQAVGLEAVSRLWIQQVFHRLCLQRPADMLICRLVIVLL